LFAWPYGVVGLVLGVSIVVGAFEQLGGAFQAIGFLSAPASADWLGWLLMCGLSLARTKPDGQGSRFFIVSALAMVAVIGALIWPAIG